MIPHRSLLLAMLVLSAMSCKPSPPPETEAVARSYLSVLRSGDIDSAIALTHRSAQGVATPGQLTELHDLLATQPPPDSAIVVSFTTSSMHSARYSELAFESHRDTTWLVAVVQVVDSAGTYRVRGLRAQVLPESLGGGNNFTIGGKSLKHKLVFSMTVLCVLFTIGVSGLMLKIAPARKWVWAAVALVGVGRVVINWATEETHLEPFYVQLFGGSLTKNDLTTPWMMTFSIPVGAVYSLWRALQGRSSGGGVEVQPLEPEA